MRLHRLVVTGFGPFAGREEIDFDEVSRHGVFLLHGQTGAGKTSLLDAICFALFGSVPGARSQSERLTSDHGVTTRPQVTCEFTAAGRRLQVVRSPQWQRPKSRGSGTTVERAHVQVAEYTDGQWHNLANRADEAGQVLADVLGMGKEQFTKVVLLPQGDFAAFLRANADERKSLLEKLFGTARFAQVEDWLAESRNLARADLQERDGLRSDLLARADERAQAVPGIDRTELQALAASPPDQVGQQSAALLQRWQQLATASAQAAADAATAATTRADDARAEHDRQRARLRQADALVRALSDQQAQLDAAERLQADRARLQRGELAERVRSQLRTLVHADEARQRAADEVEAARQRLAAVSANWPHPPPDHDIQLLTEAAGQRRGVIQRIDELLAEEADLQSAHADLARLDVLLAAEHETANGLQAGLDELRESLQHTVGQREAALPTAATVGYRQTAADASRARLQAAERAVALRAAAESATDRYQAAVDQQQEAQARYLELVQRRLDGMAAELAAALTTGLPCPVCGAADHPSPARSADLVGAEQVAAAREQAEALAAIASGLSADRTQAQEDLAAAVAASAGSDPQAAADALVAATEAVDAAVRAAHQVAHHDQEIAETTATIDRLQQQLTEHRRRAATLTSQITPLQARIAQTARSVESARAGYPTLAHRQSALRADIDALTSLSTALSEQTAADQAFEDAVATTDSDCAAIGFSTRLAAEAALLSDAEHTLLRGRVQEGSQAAATAAARLHDPDTVEAAAGFGLASSWPPEGLTDTEQTLTELTSRRLLLSDRAAQAAEAADRHVAEATQATGHAALVAPAAAAIKQLATRVRELVDATAPLRERAATLDELANTAKGVSASNTRKVRLAAFVLEARLEQVAEAASQRLLHMSDGRYTLLHSEIRGKGGRRSGLGLRVMDSWTSQERDTASLSGGESFLASLALALGLADVVQAESGGLAIETLFIDEGFGSLDDDTLELVMQVLDQLREGGRAVGVVSHVPELRTRIPAQVVVSKTRAGSQVSQVSHAS